MTPPGSSRLFFALWPTDGVRAAIQAYADAWQWPVSSVRVAREDLHVTLHFLGNVADDTVAGLQKLHVDFAAFELELGVTDLWPRGVAVLLPTTIPLQLLHLHQALARRVVDLGLTLDQRAYRPHVTLARKAARATPPAELAAIRWPVDRCALVLSNAQGEARYTVIGEFSAR